MCVYNFHPKGLFYMRYIGVFPKNYSDLGQKKITVTKGYSKIMARKTDLHFCSSYKSAMEYAGMLRKENEVSSKKDLDCTLITWQSLVLYKLTV